MADRLLRLSRRGLLKRALITAPALIIPKAVRAARYAVPSDPDFWFPNISPKGPVEIDWDNPITSGLVYVIDFAHPKSDANNLGSQFLAPQFQLGGSGDQYDYDTTTLTGRSPGGLGLVISSSSSLGGIGTHANSNFAAPQTAGSLLILARASFTPTDSVSHYLCTFGNDTSGPAITFTKHSDNSWHFGWHNASDTRVVASASGTFSQNDVFTVGGSWQSSGTALYCKANLIGSNAVAPSTGATSGQITYIGESGASGGGGQNSWLRTAFQDAIYWLLMWNRALSDAEFKFLEAYPWSWLRPARAITDALTAGASGSANYMPFFTGKPF